MSRKTLAQLGFSRRKFLIAAAAAATSAPPAWSAEYPDRPVRMIIPFPPGGSTDAAGRILAGGLEKILGKPVVVENRAGASGAIGVDAVARSAPDGYTIGLGGTGPMILAPIMGPLPNYKPEDLAIAGNASLVELVMLARRDFEGSTLADLIKAAKANPGKITYAESGGPTYLSFELFKKLTDTDIRRVPYKGDAPALNDLIGGHVDLAIVSVSGAVGQIKSGMVKALGVTTSARSKALPEVPAIGEAVPGYSSNAITVLITPAGTPEPIIKKLNGALNEVLAQPDVVRQYQSLGLATQPQSPDEAAALLKSEMTKWAKLVKDANIPTEK